MQPLEDEAWSGRGMFFYDDAAWSLGDWGWMVTTPEDLNLGRCSPNLFSTPAKVAAARLYPPMCSGLIGGSSEIRDFGVGSEPAGRLEEKWERIF